MSNNQHPSNNDNIPLSTTMILNHENQAKGTSNYSKQSGYNSMNFLEPFQVFCIQKRSEIQKSNPLLSSSDVTSLLGKMWRSMSISHRLPYTEMASQYNKSKKQNDDQTFISSYSNNSLLPNIGYQSQQQLKFSHSTFPKSPSSSFFQNKSIKECDDHFSKSMEDDITNNIQRNFNINDTTSNEFSQTLLNVSNKPLIITPKSNNSNLFIPNLTIIQRIGINNDISEISLNLLNSNTK